MIHYRCPNCAATLESQDNAAGSKGVCPNCGQRLQIPFQRHPMVGVGKLSPVDLPAPQRQPGNNEAATDQRPEEPRNPSDHEDEPSPSPTDKWKTGLLAFGFTLVLLLGTALIFALASLHSGTVQGRESLSQRPSTSELNETPRAPERRRAKAASTAVVEMLGLVWFYVFFLTAVVGFAFVLIAIFGTSNSCPHCHKWWGRVFLGKKLIKQNHAYKTVTRFNWRLGGFTGHYGSRKVGGWTYGTTARKQQVYVLRSTFENHYGCKYCDNKWTAITTEDSEDFDLD